MRTRYRYRVIMCLGNGPFLYHDTYHRGEAINIACMLQKAQGHSGNPSGWTDITNANCRSVTADNIEMQRMIMEGDMSEVMRECELEAHIGTEARSNR